MLGLGHFYFALTEVDDAEGGRRKGQSIDSVVNAIRQHRGDNLQIEYSRAFDSMPSQQVNPPSS